MTDISILHLLQQLNCEHSTKTHKQTVYPREESCHLSLERELQRSGGPRYTLDRGRARPTREI